MPAIILDTETTGITEPVPIQVAWLTVQPGMEMGEVTQEWFSPGKPIEFGAMATHHITNEMVADKPAWGSWSLPAGTDFLIGHNVDYDWQAIGSPEALDGIPLKRICTLALARSIWPMLDSHKLGALIYFLEPERGPAMAKNAHGAAADIGMTFILLQHIIKAVPGVVGWRGLHLTSETARVPTIMSFGKHKGTAIRDLPGDYVSWLLRQPDIDPYLKKALTA